MLLDSLLNAVTVNVPILRFCVDVTITRVISLVYAGNIKYIK